MYEAIKKCRICGNTNLVTIVNLGRQYLTGVFPKNKNEKLTSGPLKLLKCRDDRNRDACGLVQLGHNYDFKEVYGMNYGYRSGLNQSMISHLHNKVNSILERIPLFSGDLVLDIGSNDSTLLQAYPKDIPMLLGIDPTGKKFKEYYPDYIHLVPEFFSLELFKQKFGSKKAKIITSIAMFYDLESPLDFMREVYEILTDDGVWIFEQSYMPDMLRMNAYDTICHEHLEYYGLKQIRWMTDRVGFKIIDVKLNDVNGGSFSVTAAKASSAHLECTSVINRMLKNEEEWGLATIGPYKKFKRHVKQHRRDLRNFIHKIKAENKKIIGYGASTKGNVILQFCGLTDRDIPYIAEVNKDKFGCYTPGTHIPIISEEEARRMEPDYFLVLPWHFKKGFLLREKAYLKRGGHFIFPLPAIEVV